MNKKNTWAAQNREVTDFKLDHYRYGAWCIREKYYFSKDSKKHGEFEWRISAYSHDLKSTANSLLARITAQGTYAGLRDIVIAVENAEASILAELRQIISERNGKNE